MLHDINSQTHQLHSEGLTQALAQRKVPKNPPKLYMRRTRHPDTGALTPAGAAEAINLARTQVELLKQSNYVLSRDFHL